MNTYKANGINSVLCSDGRQVPLDDPEYLAWLAEGNTPEPADPLPNPRIAEIQAELAALDLKLIRPLSEGEADRVAELVAQKAALRAELATL